MKRMSTLLLLLFFLSNSYANNIRISGVTVSGSDVSFTLSWDNSWNTMSNIDPLYPNNWDAAWIFIKYQNAIDNLWKHASVSTNPSDHSVSGAGGVLQVDAVPDGMGVFVRCSSTGNGNISDAVVTLKMGALTGSGAFNFKVFGVEMVYVPQAPFQLGDGQVSGVAYFTPQDIDATKQASGIGSAALYSGSPALPATYPMGYDAFYSMKYEITLEQWADFLNTLTYDQQAARIRSDAAPNSPTGTFAYVNVIAGTYPTIQAIEIAVPGANNTVPAIFGCDFNSNNVFNEPGDGQNIALAGISKQDLMAYLDWSALRPFTELEYEKMGRGTRPRVSGELAWGTSTINFYRRQLLSDAGLATEYLSGVTLNGRAIVTVVNANGSGPARSGVFATASTGRQSSGASFYGIMELTGNVYEMCVAADASGALFTGSHGNGLLTTTGEPDVSGWPAGNIVTGFMLRGNTWGGMAVNTSVGSQTQFSQLSYRYADPGTARAVSYGGRGVRTAP